MSSASRHSNTRILTTLSAVFALAAFDQAAAGMMLPAIRDEMNLSLVASLWFVGAYWTALAGFAATCGRIVDVYGPRNGIFAGLVVTSAGSFAAATADSGTVLVCARAVQGLGTAIALPAALGVLATSPLCARPAAAFETLALTSVLFVAVGTPVAAAVVEPGAWRALFWMQLPVLFGIACTLAPEADPAPAGRRPATPFPLRGAWLWAGGLGGVVLAATQVPAWGWSSPRVRISFVTGSLLLLGFRFLEARSEDPLLRLRAFRTPAFAYTNAAAFAGQSSLVSVIVFAPLYLQRVAGLRPIESAVALLPGLLMLLLGGFLRSKSARFATAAKIAAAVQAVALGWLAVATQTHGGPLPPPALGLWGLSLPLLVPRTRFAAIDIVAESRAHVSGAALSAQLLGGCLGFTLAGTALALTGNFATVYASSAAAALVASVVAVTASRAERS
jgi:MFS family permease